MRSMATDMDATTQNVKVIYTKASGIGAPYCVDIGNIFLELPNHEGVHCGSGFGAPRAVAVQLNIDYKSLVGYFVPPIAT
eukprot:XP_001706645.1 Hypothetical protein GL50803_3759 [Giardia lamblia ATCC 50803]